MPAIRIPGLPDFTDDPLNPYSIDDLSGWWDTAGVQATMLPNGGGQGMVAAGTWGYTEKYTVLSGTVLLPAADQDAARRAILTNLPPFQDTVLGYLGEGWETDKQIFVRTYDKVQIERAYNHFTFQVPLVQTDPFKYGLVPLTESMGIFTGEKYTREYVSSGASYYTRGYAGTGAGPYTRTYTLLETIGGLPITARLTSGGDVDSQRVTLDLTGPLTNGWYVTNDATGERLYAQVTVPAGMVATFDCYHRTATLNGTDITAKTFGDWLTLAPGENSFRLFSAGAATGHATVTALAAYL